MKAKDKQPSVTIGIPVFNEEKYLAETIESALNQTYDNYKIIISDNCSTDNSYKIAKKYADKSDKIELVRQNENIGSTDNFKFYEIALKVTILCG